MQDEIKAFVKEAMKFVGKQLEINSEVLSQIVRIDKEIKEIKEKLDMRDEKQKK